MNRFTYHIDRDYRKLIVWEADPKTRARVSQRTCKCVSGLTRPMRYLELRRVLEEEFGIKAPGYRETR